MPDPAVGEEVGGTKGQYRPRPASQVEPPLELVHSVPHVPLGASRQEEEADVASTAAASGQGCLEAAGPETPGDAAGAAVGNPAVATDSASSTLGVSLSLLQLLLSKAEEEVARQSVFGVTTTHDVCELVVIPETKQQLCSYLDLYRDKLDESGKPYVGTGTVFVSHAWNYAFATSVAVAQQYQDSKADRQFFWFDLCTNIQHRSVTSSAARDHTWWSTTFKESIEALGTVMLVLQPWHSPVPLTRSW